MSASPDSARPQEPRTPGRRKRAIAKYIALVIGSLLGLIGLLHAAVNIPAVQRAVSRGDISARMGPQLTANVALAGIALSLLGVIVVLSASGLERGARTAWRLVVLIGVFFVLAGAGAYLWLPRARVLVLSAMGAALCSPLLWWRKEFAER